MSPTTLYVEDAAELFGSEGPTGEFVEVTEGQIQDAGENVLFSGTAVQCRMALKRFVGVFRRTLRLVPTKYTRHTLEISGADHTWWPAIA